MGADDNLAPLFYLLQLNIISVISPKITLTLCLLLAFCKNGILLYLEKNWSSQNRSSRTDSAGPDEAETCEKFVVSYRMLFRKAVDKLLVNKSG